MPSNVPAIRGGYTVAFPAALQFLLDMAKQGHMVPLIA